MGKDKMSEGKNLKNELNRQYDKVIETTELYDSPNVFLKFINGLCDKAKETLYFGIVSSIPPELAGIFENDRKLSPIEQIFLIAYLTLSSNLSGFIRWKEGDNGRKTFECPLPVAMSEIYAQCDVDASETTYIVDFVIDFMPVHANTGFCYAIELDGYDYHSSKAQMNKDYERERELQKLGYKVIRFTGSQIYKDPFGCAKEVIEMILADAAGLVEYL